MLTRTRIEYCTVVTFQSVGLDKRVNDFIERGWHPLGGVSIAISRIMQPESGAIDVSYAFAQAMTKEHYIIFDE